MFPAFVCKFRLLRNHFRCCDPECVGHHVLQLFSVLSAVRFEKQDLRVSYDVLRLKIERGQISEAGSTLVVCTAFDEGKCGETGEFIEV